MKTGSITPILALLLAAACLASEEQPAVTTFETRLLGVWTLRSSEPKPQPKSCRLIQLDFQPNGVIRWVTRCDGKTNEQTGRYSIETSANVYHRYTLTHIIRIQTTGSPPESVIHLVGADIGSDNRVPVHAEVLKFRDAFVSSFVFVKDDAQPSTEGDGKPAPQA